MKWMMKWILSGLLLGCSLWVGCEGDEIQAAGEPTGDIGRTTSAPDATTGDTRGVSGSDIDAGELGDAVGDTDTTAGGDACESVVCGADQCGPLLDPCTGATLDCGGCASGTCVAGLCECVPTTCEASGADCGPIDDGCGGMLDCPSACGPDDVCDAGTCVPPWAWSVVSGDQQQVLPGQRVTQPAVVRLVDAGGAPVPGEAVSISCTEGASTAPSTTTTDTTGAVALQPRAGRGLGTYSCVVWLASAPAVSATIELEAVAPSPGTMLPVANAEQVETTPSSGDGPSATTTLSDARSVVSLSDGTLYFAGRQRVWSITPLGAATVVAGTGASGDDGDFGPAVDARFTDIGDLAIDEATDTLYVLDRASKRVRAVRLSDGMILPYAGGGTANGANGDGGLATSAVFGFPTDLTVANDGALWISDPNQQRIRRVDPTTTIIDTAIHVSDASPTCGGTPVLTGYSLRLPMVFHPDGHAFVGGDLACGGSEGIGNGPLPGVLRWSPGGQLEHVAGRATGTTASGVPGTSTQLVSAIQDLTLDAGGHLFVATSDGRIRRLDSATGVVSDVAGGSAAPAGTGDFGPATSASLSSGLRLAVSAGHLVVADEHHATLRAVWAQEDLNAPTGTMSLHSAVHQSVWPTEQSAPIVVDLKRADGGPLVGARVEFSVDDPAAYLSQSRADTSGLGQASALVRGPRDLAIVTFAAHMTDIHGIPWPSSPATATVEVVQPASETVVPLVNAGQMTGGASAGPAVVSSLGDVRDVLVLPTGDVFVAAGAQIVRVSPSGVLDVVAGSTALTGDAGDNGPAVTASLTTPEALALGPAGGLLVADKGAGRIRRIDLNSGLIAAYAGGGTAGLPAYGDGGAALGAFLGQVDDLGTAPNGDVVVAQGGYGKLRRIDAASGLISTVLDADSGWCTPGEPLKLSKYTQFMPLTAAQGGGWYLGGSMACGASGNPNNGPLHGVMHWSVGGGLTRVAGADQGASADGVAAVAATLDAAVRGLEQAPDGRLFLAVGHRIRMIDTAGIITTVSGVGPQGGQGDYGPWTAAEFSNPRGLSWSAIDPGLVVADTNNHAVRLLLDP